MCGPLVFVLRRQEHLVEDRVLLNGCHLAGVGYRTLRTFWELNIGLPLHLILVLELFQFIRILRKLKVRLLLLYVITLLMHQFDNFHLLFVLLNNTFLSLGFFSLSIILNRSFNCSKSWAVKGEYRFLVLLMASCSVIGI